MKLSGHETHALSPGVSVKHYTVVDLLGCDHQGCLYRAECNDTDSSVMLYEYLPAGLAARSGHAVQALPGKAEALAKAVAGYATRLRAAGLVGHPALPTLDDIWTDNATVYAVGPWRPGRSLLTELSSPGGNGMAVGTSTLDSAQLATWARTVCDALSALHQHGLFHLNLSPAMIRVLESGELQLPLIGSTIFSQDAPAWIAPEQHPLNPKPVGCGSWTDIYQLSALIHQWMTGQMPPTVMSRWEGAPLERLAELGEVYAVELQVATRKGLAMHASARPQSPEKWLQLAGLPDRRELPRYDSDAIGFDAGHRRFPAASAVQADKEPDTGPASLPASRPMELGTGHQPLPANVQERLDRLEKPKGAEKPVWMWAFVLMAVVTLLVAIVVRP
jgi:serine/threonine protein kinase